MPVRGEKGPIPVIIAAAAISAAISVLATSLAIGYLRQKELRRAAGAESARANEAAAHAREAVNRGNRARDQAEELASFILDDLRDELNEIGRSDLLAAAAEKAVTYFDNLPPELVMPESQDKLASVLLTLSDARYQQGDYTAAIAAAERAIQLWKQLAALSDPEARFTIRLGRAMGELGLYQNQSGDPYAARETFSAVRRLYENPPARMKDDGWRDHGLAKARLGLGEVERLRKNYADARAEYAESIKHITQALARNANEISWLQMLMTLHNNTGVACMHEKNYLGAEESFQRALESNRALIRLEPQNRRWEKELATTLLNLGALLHLRKEYARAEPFLREALALRESSAAWDPKSTRAARKLAHAWHRMAVFRFDTGSNSNALACARGALNAFRRLLTIEPGDSDAIGEMEEYARKYHERLIEAGLPDAAAQIITETAAFAEANRTGKPGADAWDKLLATLRETSASGDSKKTPNP